VVTRFILIKDAAGLDAYLDRETGEWPQKEASRQAKTALLERGIPFSGEALEDCIKRQNRWAVERFIQGGFSPDRRNQTGVPLICLAARAGDRDIVDLLLKAGAAVNLQAEDRGTSALIDSALGKHLEIMKLLLNAGADINLKSKDGQSALIISVGLNDEASVELLLKAGAKADDPDLLGVSARKYAVLFNKPSMVELFHTYAGQKEGESQDFSA
jgi:ankyrin repeat protein